jgi:hypothetical protein
MILPHFNSKSKKILAHPRGVLAIVSAHARTLNPPQTAIITIIDVVIIVEVVIRGPQKNVLTIFCLISAHTNFHGPRTTPSGRKVIRRRKREREEEKKQ